MAVAIRCADEKAARSYVAKARGDSRTAYKKSKKTDSANLESEEKAKKTNTKEKSDKDE